MRPFFRTYSTRPCALQNLGALKRSLPACRLRSDNASPSSSSAGPDPPPFHGYLIDALDAPLHTVAPATSTPPKRPPPDELPKTDEEEKLAKARVVFGSRLAGPAERKEAIAKASTDVAGVMVPPRPDEPDNCCMSGCVNCVWDVYRDELEEWAAKSAEARSRVEAQRAKMRVAEGGIGGEDDGMGSGLEGLGVPVAGEEGDLFEGIPVGIREFMKQEKRLKERHRREGSVAG